ncbi:MAG: hypothetical protein IT438_13135 [Phycisphaerales bacterium]|nr:hypothetical protein [Phycisphaerales bacterium]
MIYARIAIPVLSLALLGAIGCSRDLANSTAQPVVASHTQTTTAPAPASVFPETGWTFNGEPGRVVTTPHYRLHTTITDVAHTQRLAAFMESALVAYRAGCGVLEADELPDPSRSLDVFLYRTRGQWDAATRQLLGGRAAPLLAMPRGGYTLAGRVMLYDIGRRDTQVLLAHEGWHQYAQVALAGPLPEWLDEGLATMMEGFMWRTDPASGATALAFVPWANPERFDELRRAAAHRRMWTLDRLVATGSPLDSASMGNTPDPLAYYAQVWALCHFLREGRGGTCAEAVRASIRSAARGGGVAAFQTTFGSIGDIERDYAAFVGHITRQGARELIVRGESPVTGPNRGLSEMGGSTVGQSR